MKYFFGLMLSLFFLNSYADEIRVKRMTRDRNLERSYILTTNLSDEVAIDCQSFIQGLRIGEKESAVMFMLDPYECEAMQERIRKSLRRLQNHCIDVEEDIRADYSC